MFSPRSNRPTTTPLPPTGDDPLAWLKDYFPAYTTATFGQHHGEFWQWVWSIQRGARPASFVAIWPRGGAKSTSAELACVALAARKARKYVLYVSATQAQADNHVQNVQALLESSAFAGQYPTLATRGVNKYGSPQGWRRNRLRTDSGFTVDALGLDVAARGTKIEEDRPDLIVIDDVDGETDSLATVEKKIAILTRKLIPAGSSDLAVLAIQNLVHPDSIFSRLSDGRADFLRNRVLSGPIPAIYDLEHEDRAGRTVLTGGKPAWEGQDLTICQQMVDDMGLQAFLAECQQEVSVLRERIFAPDWWAEGRNRYLHRTPLTYGEIAETWIMVDSAMKDGQEHDYTAFGVWQVLSTGRLRLREIRTMKVQFPELITATEDIAAEYHASGLLRGVVIEDRVSGTSAAQTLRASARYPWLRPMIMPKVFPGSKPERGRIASPWCARNMIELPHPDTDVPWLLPFERTLYDFPFVPHDDDVDVFIMGILFFRNYLDLAWQRQLASVGAAV